MTLVVARQVDNEIFVIGDTKFTADAEDCKSEASQYIGGLKVVLLTPGLCVAFAGNVQDAKNAIQGIYDEGVNLFDKNLVLEYFLGHHQRSLQRDKDNGATFVVAIIVGSNEQSGSFVKEIFRIADSKIHWENQTAHIGDGDAFDSFQKVIHGGLQNSKKPTFEIASLGERERPQFNISLSAAMRAMQDVIDNPQIPSVDGYRTVVISDDDQFRYVEYVQVNGRAISIQNAPGSPVSYGGAAEGSDIKHVGMFAATGHGVFPVYSITGGFGLIYHPEKCFEPKSISSCSLEEFRVKVEAQILAAHERVLNYQSRFF